MISKRGLFSALVNFTIVMLVLTFPICIALAAMELFFYRWIPTGGPGLICWVSSWPLSAILLWVYRRRVQTLPVEQAMGRHWYISAAYWLMVFFWPIPAMLLIQDIGFGLHRWHAGKKGRRQHG